MIKEYFKLIRPKHWIKNFLVFVAIIFSFSFSIANLEKAMLAFFSFSLCASAVYVLNDIFDVEKDKKHPEKKKRPIASGKISIRSAVILLLVLISVGIVAAYTVNQIFLLVSLFYLILNFLYSWRLKNVPIIDTMIVAFGFVLRVIGGAFAIGVHVSHWLLLCTFFISLFLAFGKRKNEMDILKTVGSNHRKSISEYTEGFINQMLSITGAISVVFYALYTIDPATIEKFNSDNLVYTTPIAVFGVLRYFHLMYNKNEGGDPVKLFLKDGQLISAVIVWLIAVVAVYYHYL